MKIETIALQDIEVQENLNLRTDYGSLEGLKESIRSRGLHQPLLVREIPNGYLLVAGYRRHRALLDLNTKTVDCIVLPESTTISDALLKNMVENVVRKMLNPMEEAQAIDLLVQQGLDKDTICNSLGWSKQLFTTRKKLLNLSDSLKKGVKEERISPQQGFILSDLPEDKHDVWIGKAEKMVLVDLKSMVERQLNKGLEPPKEKEEKVDKEDLKDVVKEIKGYLRKLAKSMEIDLELIKNMDLSPLDEDTLLNLNHIFAVIWAEFDSVPEESKATPPPKPKL